MDGFIMLTVYVAVLFAISLTEVRFLCFLGSEESRLYLMIAFSAGIMLGVLFIMLLPEALEKTEESGYYTWTGYLILLDVLIVLFADNAVKKLLPGRDTEEKEHDITTVRIRWTSGPLFLRRSVTRGRLLSR